MKNFFTWLAVLMIIPAFFLITIFSINYPAYAVVIIGALVIFLTIYGGICSNKKETQNADIRRKVAMAASKFRGPEIVVDRAAVGLFKNRTDIEVVEVFPGVGIHANEFQGCTNLRQISLPDGLTEIGSYAF